MNVNQQKFGLSCFYSKINVIYSCISYLEESEPEVVKSSLILVFVI